MKRGLGAPSSDNKLVVDNGVQPKQLEVDPNIVDFMEARSKKNLRGD